MREATTGTLRHLFFNFIEMPSCLLPEHICSVEASRPMCARCPFGSSWYHYSWHWARPQVWEWYGKFCCKYYSSCSYSLMLFVVSQLLNYVVGIRDKAANSNLKIEILQFLSILLSSHEPSLFQVYIPILSEVCIFNNFVIFNFHCALTGGNTGCEWSFL